MDKRFIVDEIRRTAAENGGKPLGRRRFETHTGIRESDWYGKFWASWGAALREAGFDANVKQEKLDEDLLLGKLVDLVREVGKFPTYAEMRMKARTDEGFPSTSTFNRVGSRTQLAARVLAYCQAQGEGFEDVAAICAPIADEVQEEEGERSPSASEEFGSVYLLKAGRYYKIGRSNAVGRRERELAIQLPERPKTVHVISTDDPVGIEAYWHDRFADKRKGGEWFDLTRADVQAFKRRRFM